MFEDQTNKANPPANLPSEPDDIFAGVEKDDSVNPATDIAQSTKAPDAIDAGLLKRKEPITPIVASASAPMAAPALYEMKQPVLGKILLFVLLAALLGGMGFGVWYVYAKIIKKPVVINNVVAPAVIEVNNIVPSPVVVATPTEKLPEAEVIATTTDVSAKMNNDKILFGQTIDSDKDGLDDVREKEIGTDPYNADTDTDGLSDGDEVLIWKTNPLNADTDGDSFKDGDEVRHGYNPLGLGKLFNVPTSATTTTATSSSATSSKLNTLPGVKPTK